MNQNLIHLRLLLIFTIGCALMMLTACATATQGPLQRIHIDSDPRGARIEAKRCGVSLGALQTPATVLVSRRATRCEITLHRTAYERATVLLSRNVSQRVEAEGGVEMEIHNRDDVALAVLATIGMAAGFLVDSATGARYELHPSHVFVELVPESWRLGDAELGNEAAEESWRDREEDVDPVPLDEAVESDLQDANPPDGVSCSDEPRAPVDAPGEVGVFESGTIDAMPAIAAGHSSTQ